MPLPTFIVEGTHTQQNPSTTRSSYGIAKNPSCFPVRFHIKGLCVCVRALDDGYRKLSDFIVHHLRPHQPMRGCRSPTDH